MSAQAFARAAAHPLRRISFGDPTVTIERKSDGTIYLRPTERLADYPQPADRPPASLGSGDA